MCSVCAGGLVRHSVSMEDIEERFIESLQMVLCLLIKMLKERVPQDANELAAMLHDPRFEVMARARLSVSLDPPLAISQALEILLKLDKISRR